MKQTQYLVNGLVACAVALAMISTATAETAGQGKQGRAKVIRMKGQARYTTGNSVWQPLRVGDVIKPGAIIQTSKGKGDFVDLALGDGNGPIASSGSGSGPSVMITPISYQPRTEQNFVRVWENSLLGVDKLTTLDTGADVVSDTQLDLKAGHIFGVVKKMSAASRYEVKIPNGVAGIRGTVYDITADGEVRVSSGSVVIAYVGADGTVVTQVVSAGQQFDARTGLVTPIPPGELERMLRNEGESHGGESSHRTTFTYDHTIYHVSPTHDHDHDRNDNDNDERGERDGGNGGGG
jgi:FecR-like protein